VRSVWIEFSMSSHIVIFITKILSGNGNNRGRNNTRGDGNNPAREPPHIRQVLSLATHSPTLSIANVSRQSPIIGTGRNTSRTGSIKYEIERIFVARCKGKLAGYYTASCHSPGKRHAAGNRAHPNASLPTIGDRFNNCVIGIFKVSSAKHLMKHRHASV